MISELEPPRIAIEDAGETYVRVVLEPLRRGFGTTLGNSLRRVLLSALPGAAVVSARIDQVQHEFSTIPHMKEDTTEFLLNVRGIRLRALSDRSAKLFLDVSGESKVTAADLEIPADYELINPELHLATLDSSKAKLSVALDVEQGYGYVPAGENNGLPIGVIPVDAAFAPVRRVNYTVQPTRVEQQSDFDRLILEVWTDGTTTATDAIHKAALILQQELAPFARLGVPIPEAEGEESEAATQQAERFNSSIEELNLSVRAYNCLKRSGLMTVGQILDKSEAELLRLRNFGEKSYYELMERLREMGFLDADDPRGHRPGEAPQAPPEAPLAAEPLLPDTDSESDQPDSEISSLGSALLEALREAGSDSETLG